MFTACAVMICLGITKAEAVETRYLGVQVFTYSPNPQSAAMGEDGNHVHAGFPTKRVLSAVVDDVKRRIGSVGSGQNRLAVILGPISFDHTDNEVSKFIATGFELAEESGVAIGFHLDDSMFWMNRKDLWSDAKNIEAMDWQGTPNTGRRLDWGPKPSRTAPQMCFNSKSITELVQARSAHIGKAVSRGSKKLAESGKPELFAGVIAGWETMIGQDFESGRYLGYRALMNKGFSASNPPKNLSQELEKVVKEFISLWTLGISKQGVPQAKIYSHTAFQLQGGKVTSSQINHFAPPEIAFGKTHRPGFSTYPQPGIFPYLQGLTAAQKQKGWASAEGTNILPEGLPDQTGMGMETYLAAMFNHGATLVNIFSWGIGGDAGRSSGFRVVTERDEALAAYRKFQRDEKLIEKYEGPSLMERLPNKISRIQKELPGWIQRTGKTEEASQQMGKLDAALKAQNFAEAERIADAILKMIEP